MKQSISRRNFLKMGTAAIASLAAPTLLTGCQSAPTPSPAVSSAATATTAPTPVPTEAPKEVALSLWHRYFWEPTGPTFDGFVEEFTKKYPDITVEKNVFGDEDYKSTIQVAMASDDPPNLFYAYGGNWLKFFVDEGLVADISPYWEQYKWKDRLNERALKGVSYDGKYYAVPTELTTAGIYYNKKIFQEVGIEPPEVPTWEEFLGYCDKIKAAGYLPMCLGDKEDSFAQWWWDYAVVRENGNEYRKKVVRGEVPINDKGVVAALERIMTDIFRAGNMNDNIVGLDIFGWLGLMAEGKTGMTLIHSFLPPQIIQALMPEPYEFGFFIYPQVHQDIEIANDLYVEGNQCISAKTSEKDEAAKWLDFVISEETQTKWAGISFIPTVKAAESALPPLTKGVYEMVSKYDSFAHLDLVFHPEVKTALFANIQAMLSGAVTEQEAMDTAQAVAEKAPWIGVPQGEAG